MQDTTIQPFGFQASPEQQKAIDTIIDFMREEDSIVHSLVGAAGTGKTSTLQALFARIEKEFPYLMIQVAAPTHKAVRQVQRLTKKEACTLQSMLGLRPDMNLELFSKKDMKFKKTGEEKMDSGGLLVIDEASMINDELYEVICETADYKNKKVLFVGDRLQLKPVKNKDNQESMVFKNPSCTSELLTVMRQGDDSYLLEALNVIREKIDSGVNAMSETITKTEEDGGGIELIEEPLGFLDRIREEFTSDQYLNDKDGMKVLAYRNETVGQYNEAIRSMLGFSGEPKQGEILMAYDNVSNGRGNDPKIVNSNTYEIFHVGSVINRIIGGMIIKGIMVTLKDANDYSASPTTIFLMSREENSEETKADLAVFIHNLKTSIIQSGNKSRWSKEYYPLIESFSTMEELKAGQFFVKGKTLDYGYAHTVHKSQGSTYRKVFVDGHDIDSISDTNLPIEDKNRLKYVALSRPTFSAVIFTQ